MAYFELIEVVAILSCFIPLPFFFSNVRTSFLSWRLEASVVYFVRLDRFSSDNAT